MATVPIISYGKSFQITIPPLGIRLRQPAHVAVPAAIIVIIVVVVEALPADDTSEVRGESGVHRGWRRW